MTLRLLCLGLALALLGGCAALTGIGSGPPLDTYELTPLQPSSSSGRGGHLVVEPPTSSGSLDTDRIAVRPNAFAVAYLPGASWVDTAPEHLQLLLARSLEGTGRFALVSTGGARPDPDWFLATDLQAFEVQIGPEDAQRVVVRLRAAVVADADRRILGSRTFERTVEVADTGVAAVIPAFELATREVLRDLTTWAVATAR